MKKILFIAVVYALFSCEKDGGADKQSETNLVINPSCSLVVDDPFNYITRTHGTWSYGSPSAPFCLFPGTEPCFMQEVILPVQIEIWTQNTGSPNTRPKSDQYVTSGSISFLFNEFMSTTNVYPYLSGSKANTVYGEIVCRIQDELGALPPVVTNSAYAVFIKYSQVSLPFSGPADTSMRVDFDVHLQAI